MTETTAWAGEWGTTVEDVLALCPEATLYETKDQIPAGRRGVTRAAVQGFIRDCDAFVGLIVTGWRQAVVALGGTVESTYPGAVTYPGATADVVIVSGVVAPPGTDLEQLARACRTVVTCKAAAYLEGARFPERVMPADTTYEGVLWRRWEAEAEHLRVWWASRRKALGIDPAADSIIKGTASACFPAPVYVEGWAP